MSRTRGPSKAQIILNGLKERVTDAENARNHAQAQLNIAQMMYEARLQIYCDVEKSLASKPRGNGAGKSPSPAPSAADKRRAKMICVDCHLPSANQIHTDASNSAHHPFVLDRDGSPPTAPRAEKKSSSGKQPKLAGVLNTEVEMASVGIVGGSGD